MSIPRGIRNNNPCNIRRTGGKPWVGEVQPSLDPAFKQFCAMTYGYRAALMLIQNYIRRYGCNTVRAIISRWAPASENNTQAYIRTVCERMGGFSADQAINADDRDTLCRLVAAMSYVENGRAADMGQVYAGWELLM